MPLSNQCALYYRHDRCQAAVRRCWLDEFFKHMGKPGQLPDHTTCPQGAACRNAAIAAQYNWHPMPTSDHQPKTWKVVEELMRLPSTLEVVDGLVSGEGTNVIESFHAQRCMFAPKHTYFQRWEMRNTMAKMHFNENLGRDIAYELEEAQQNY